MKKSWNKYIKRKIITDLYYLKDLCLQSHCKLTANHPQFLLSFDLQQRYIKIFFSEFSSTPY